MGLVDLHVLEAAGIRATRESPDLEPERGLDVRGAELDVVAAGDALVSFVGGPGYEHHLVRSTDFGRSWAQIALPGAQADGFGLLSDAGALLVVTDHENSRDFAWASADGIVWRGGPVATRGGYLLQYPRHLPDGRLVVGIWQAPDGEGLIASADGGASWQHIPCPRMSRLPAEKVRSINDPRIRIRRRCEPVEPAGRNLWLRGWQVSLDAGRTWRKVSVVPDPRSLIVPIIESAVALPDGGWLGSVNVIVDSGGPFVARLVRSVDGVRWVQIVTDPCDHPDHTGSSVSRPLPLGNRWLVAFTCTAKGDTPQRSQLYLVNSDGTHARLIATVERPGVSFGPPVAVGDTVVVPEIEAAPIGIGGKVSFLLLRP